MKEKIIAILSDLRPDVRIVDALDTEFNIVIDGIDILPENFSTIESIEALLKKNGVTE